MGPSVQPAADGGPGAVGHHLQQTTPLQVDQAGHTAGGRPAGGLEEAGLVQPEPARPRPGAPGSSTSWVPCSATARMVVAQPTPGRGRPPPPRGRPCRPAGTPRRGPVRSAPPEAGWRPPARSRSGPRRPAPDSARGACATTAPPAGRRSAGRAPGPCVGRAGWPPRHNPHSRSPWPWSGWRAAIRHPRARPRRAGSRPGPAAPTQTHYCVDPPGASFLQTSRIRKLCEVPGAVLTAPTPPSAGHHPTLHDEEPEWLATRPVRSAVAERGRWTGASTAATTPPARSRRSAPACATRST